MIKNAFISIRLVLLLHILLKALFHQISLGAVKEEGGYHSDF